MSNFNTGFIQIVKRIGIIILALVIGISLGYFVTNYETRYLLNRKFCGTYRGIDVYKSGEINAENFIGHAHVLDDAPDVLVETCTEMYFIGEDLDILAMGGQGGKALGITQGSVIYISTASFNADVVLHELFHSYDNANDKISDSDGFLRIMEKERNNVHVELYDEEAYSAEYFAVAGAEYLLQPEVLRKSAPETYDFIDKLIGYYN